MKHDCRSCHCWECWGARGFDEDRCRVCADSDCSVPLRIVAKCTERLVTAVQSGQVRTSDSCKAC